MIDGVPLVCTNDLLKLTLLGTLSTRPHCRSSVLLVDHSRYLHVTLPYLEDGHRKL